MLGQASKDENGTYKNGKSGDQTGVEVYDRSWYSRPWNVVVRLNDSEKREKVAMAMEMACANDLIGYDQNQRNSILTQSRALGYNLSKIANACECDCSSLVSVCCMYAGINENKLFIDNNCATTSTLRNRLKATNEVTILTDSKYLVNDCYLLRGDILLYEGHHVAINLNNGSQSSNDTQTANNQQSSVSYRAKVTTDSQNLKVRSAPNGSDTGRRAERGNTYTITKESDGWGYISELSGWSSLQYLSKVSNSQTSNTNNSSANYVVGKTYTL